MDGRIAGFWPVDEVEGKSYRLAKSRGVLDQVHQYLVLANEFNLDHIDIVVVTRLLANHDACLRRIVGVANLDKESPRGSKDALQGVGLVFLALDKDVGHQEGVAPVLIGPGEQRQPRVERRQLDGRR